MASLLPSFDLITHDEDIAELAVLGHEFFREAQELPGVFSEEHFTKSLRQLRDLGFLVLFGVRVDGKLKGAIGGCIVPDFWTGDPVLYEHFWFLTRGSRGYGMRLLTLFEDEGKARGCKRILMAHMNTLRADTLAYLYKRRGYMPLEHYYVKVLQ